MSLLRKPVSVGKYVHGTCADLANITIVVKVVFQEILALTRVMHIVSSMRLIVQTKILMLISYTGLM